MKCKNCVHYWADVEGDIPTCHADPAWPAPCEYDDFKKEEKDMSISLYDFIQQSKDWEITVFDKDYDVEVYFYKNEDGEKVDSWDESMMKLSKLLTVSEVFENGVVVDLYDVINNKLDVLKDKKLFRVTDIDLIMDDIAYIISGNVPEAWMERFVDTLSGDEEKGGE